MSVWEAAKYPMQLLWLVSSTVCCWALNSDHAGNACLFSVQLIFSKKRKEKKNRSLAAKWYLCMCLAFAREVFLDCFLLMVFSVSFIQGYAILLLSSLSNNRPNLEEVWGIFWSKTFMVFQYATLIEFIGDPHLKEGYAGKWDVHRFSFCCVQNGGAQYFSVCMCNNLQQQVYFVDNLSKSIFRLGEADAFSSFIFRKSPSLYQNSLVIPNSE